MKLMLIIDGIVHEDISELFDSPEIAKESYGDGSYIFEYAPDYVRAGWTYENGVWGIPIRVGCAYDIKDGRFYQHGEYRRILHERTTNDTMEALRKIREGDASYDWQGWLNKLDAYNLAIEETKNQEEPVYPEYPQRE